MIITDYLPFQEADQKGIVTGGKCPAMISLGFS